MDRGISRGAFRLSVFVAIAAGLLSAGSLIWTGLYRDDGAWLHAVWFGNDLVTLFAAVPLLAGALYLVGRGSRRAELVWYGALGYKVYNYAYYLFGTRLNAAFPLYVVLFVVPAIALMLALRGVDPEAIADGFVASVRERISAGYMMFTGVGLAIAWLGQWAGVVFGGVVPNLGEAGFHLVAAMDLSFMVPFFVIGAVLLWRRRGWGFIVAPIIMVQGALYTLVLTTTSSVVWLRGLPGGASEVPVWGVWTVAGAVALWLLLAGAKKATAAQ
jgi:hypothetical protein